jgi:hypothetical protein
LATRELQVTTSAGRCWHRGDHLHKAHAYNHQDIDAEISRLEKVRALLSGHTAPLKRGMPPEKSSTMSAEGRARIAAAQKKRWAKAKRK